MSKERQVLENLVAVAEYFYSKTGDKWYLRLKNATETKLGKGRE